MAVGATIFEQLGSVAEIRKSDQFPYHEETGNIFWTSL